MAIEIVQIGRDHESIRAYVEQYKSFRLYALQTEPEAFASTYEDEVKFTDQVWYARLANPDAVTFLAMQDGQTLSTLTALGHLKYGPEELSASSSPWKAEIESSEEAAPLHFRIFGMFTRSENRGQGLGKLLMETAIRFGEDAATTLKRPFVGSIVAEETNLAALRLYQKVGFVPVNKLPFGEAGRMIVLLKYLPSLTSVVP